jgi:tetratricopeptide (TPR) repeat protein
VEPHGLGAWVALLGLGVNAFFDFPLTLSSPVALAAAFMALLALREGHWELRPRPAVRSLLVATTVLALAVCGLGAWRLVQSERHCGQAGSALGGDAAFDAKRLEDLLDGAARWTRSDTCQVIIGDGHARLGDHQAASEWYERALETHPHRALYQYKLASSLFEQGEYGRVHPWLDSVLSRLPDEPRALRLRLITLLKQGRKQEALALFPRYLAPRPEDENMHFNHALLCHEQGDALGALASLDHLIGLEGEYAARASDVKGQILLQQGDTQAALQSYRRALELDPDVPRAESIRSEVERLERSLPQH